MSQRTPSLKQCEMLDVAIIGAGPVGLATAAAVLKAQSPPFRVQVLTQGLQSMLCMSPIDQQPAGA